MVRYQPLDAAIDEIRLLQLMPGKAETPLRCHLITVSLQDSPTFEALSYVWGSPNIKTPIEVEGDPFPITTNLESALRALRRRRKSRLLWIDAICINQDDNAERSVQVPLMGSIYAGANCVVTWLGPSTPLIDRALSWVQTYRWKKPDSASVDWLKLHVTAPFTRRARQEKELAVYDTVEGFLDVFALPYWTRMWTFQEYCLPGVEPVCVCGTNVFSASALAEAADVFMNRLIAALERSGSRFQRWRASEGGMSEDQEAYVKKVERRIDTIIVKNRSLRVEVAEEPEMMRNRWSEVRNPLFHLLVSTADRLCLDPRDKVYAIYGLVPAAQAVYPPDYTKPVEQVLAETTAYLINHESGPLYKKFGLRNDRLSTVSYPSWVPDFTQADINSRNVHRSAESTLAPVLQDCQCTPPASVSQDLTTLILPARNLGPVKVALQFASTVSEVVSQVKELLLSNSWIPESTTIHKPGTVTSRMARLVVAHTLLSPDAEIDGIVGGFQRMAHNIDSGQPLEYGEDHIPTESVCIRSAEELVGKVLFITGGGLIGIGISGIETGDELTLPPWVKVPFLLRRGEDRFYRMAGMAYVDGLMDADTLDEEAVGDARRREMELLSVR